MKTTFKDLMEITLAEIEPYLLDAQSILQAKNTKQLSDCIENSQTNISSVYEKGMDEINMKMKEVGLKTNFEEVQNYILSEYIGFNLQIIVFEEFFPTIENTAYSIENIPNLLEGGEKGDNVMKCARFFKLIGLAGKSMFAVSKVIVATEISPMDAFISDLNESTVIGFSWDSPLISTFPPKESAFFTKLYSAKNWKSKFHQRCVNVINEMYSNIVNTKE